jgi:hypothetical protein
MPSKLVNSLRPQRDTNKQINILHAEIYYFSSLASQIKIGDKHTFQNLFISFLQILHSLFVARILLQFLTIFYIFCATSTFFQLRQIKSRSKCFRITTIEEFCLII